MNNRAEQVIGELRRRITDGTPLPGAVLDVWQSDADGRYSGFSEIPAGILRGKVITGTEGRFELRTIAPAPYTVPHDGPFGRMLAACRWHLWRPAHVHLIVTASEHERLITQLYLGSSEFRLAPARDAVPI